jgi:hypothetical protein
MGRPDFKRFVLAKRPFAVRVLTVALLVLAAGILVTVGMGIWKRPIPAILSLATGIVLHRRSAQLGSSQPPEPTRQMFYGTLLAGGFGEFVTELLWRAPEAGAGLRIVYSISFGTMVGLAAFLVA